MSEQLTLEGKTETEERLTERQRFALELIRDLGPIPSSELGAYMHARRGKHPAESRCRFCADEGKAIGGELRKKKTLGVRERRGEGWYVSGHSSARTNETDRYDPSTAPIPY